MKVTLDRRLCTRWQASCESCFSTRLIQNNFDAADCGLGVEEDGQEAIEFHITDRDGSQKLLVVNSGNRAEAMDSWMLLWQQLSGSIEPPAILDSGNSSVHPSD